MVVFISTIFRISLVAFILLGVLIVALQALGVIFLSGSLVSNGYQLISPVAFWSSAIAAVTGFILHYFQYGEE